MSERSTPVPAQSLSPLAAQAGRVLAHYEYDVTAAIEAVDDAVPGIGGLFEPGTTANELRTAFERILADDAPPRPDTGGTLRGERAILYVDGSSRGNPGPAGAGAVIVDEGGAELARLGMPVGSRAGNNAAEYAALHLGLRGLSRYEPAAVEVRIDSMTVIRDVWGEQGTAIDGVEAHRRAITEFLERIADHRYRHLADSDPNPADALATVGADVAALGPGG